MPTGYTAAVKDGEITEFKEFAMICARAFGALIMLRDEPLDAEIPEKISLETSYHSEELEKALKALENTKSMTEEEMTEAALEEYTEALNYWQEAFIREGEERERYESMLAKVYEWVPPTEEHKSMKEFMIKQLKESIAFDCTHYTDDDSLYFKKPTLKTGPEWFFKKIESIEREIKYHTEEKEKEMAREASRQAWIDALRASLV